MIVRLQWHISDRVSCFYFLLSARTPTRRNIIEVHWMTLAEAEAAIHTGELTDAKTQCALYRYRLWCSAAAR